jgi:hypothetical protein
MAQSDVVQHHDLLALDRDRRLLAAKWFLPRIGGTSLLK